MMSVLPLAKIGLLLGRPQYVEEARRQFMLHIKYLVDRKTGLWFHGWTFDGRHHFANALWARGNCWVTIAIPEFIELLDLPARRRVCATSCSRPTCSRSARWSKHQDEGGLWHTLIDDPKSYLEASATAGFAYGILKSVRKGYIGAEYEERRHPRGEGGARRTSTRPASSRTCRSARRCSTISMATARSR